jgi:zinc protease
MTRTLLPALAAAIILALAFAGCSDSPDMRVVALPGKSPIVNLRLVFLTGAASDPAGKEGAAALTASMLTKGGTRDRTYKEILDAFFPMAASVSAQTDKEMVVFSAATHVENLDACYTLFRSMLLEPGWRPDDLERLRDEAINYLQVGLRSNNEEELGKEVLYNALYQGHPYGHHSTGTVAALRSMTLDDLKRFYEANFTRANLIIGLAGGYPDGFLDRVKRDFAALPAGPPPASEVPPPASLDADRLLMIEKDTRSVAYSIGFPIDVTRKHPDFPALLVMQSYFGQHRNSAGRLFTSIRQERGINYGDYAYIEYFPRGMFQFQPDPNLARSRQIFQIWIRPVEPPDAIFTLRLALYELDKLLKDGLSQDDFDRTVQFLSKFVNVLTSTKDAELGYAIDSAYYGIPEYNQLVKDSLARLTVEDVNRAIRKHLRPDRLQIVAVATGCEALKQKILSGAPSPKSYNSEKPAAILEEDKIVAKWPIPVTAENVTIVDVETFFE